MQVTAIPFKLAFKHPFGLSVGTRTHTDVVFVKIEHNGFVGYGEAAMPPYLADTVESVLTFIHKVDLSKYTGNFVLEDTVQAVYNTDAGNMPAKAALDMALHDLYCKMQSISLSNYWQLEHKPTLYTTFTIGIGDTASVLQKIEEGKDFPTFKVKLGSTNDEEMITTLQANSSKSFSIDANQGWLDKEAALKKIHWLAARGCTFIEQPMPKTMTDELAWLKQHSPLPIIGDESIQGLADVDKAAGLFHGINIKLMKCGGLFTAKKMIQRANELGLKILIGCMSESTCGVSAAAHLTPLAHWADLDGPALIKNDPFTGVVLNKGHLDIDYAKKGHTAEPISGELKIES